MRPDEQLAEILKSEGIEAAGRIVAREFAMGGFYVFVEVVRDATNQQRPSNRRLHEIREALSATGIDVEFILVDERALDIEAGARASLLHAFGSLVRNAFLSTTRSSATIWLDLKREATREEMSSISERSAVYLENFGLQLSNIYSTRNENVASRTALIQILRKISPATSQRIRSALEERGFSVPSDDWIDRRLDGLRRGGFIARNSSGAYVLTYKGLLSLGTAKNARSPDISRLLDIARRGN